VVTVRVSSVLYEGDNPLDERRSQSLAVNEAIRDDLTDHLDEQQKNLRYALGAGVAGVVLGIIALLANVGAVIAGVLALAGLAISGGGYAYVTSQAPDVSVNRGEKGYWASHCLPVGDGAVVYDGTRSVEPTAFELERLEDDTKIGEANERLDELGEFPVVMPHGKNVEKELTRTLQSVKAEIQNAEQHTVEAPVIPAGSTAADAVEEFASLADADDVDVDVSVSTSEAREDVEALDDLEQMAASEDTEAELEELSETSRELVNDLSGMQETAIDLLNDHVGTAADAFGLVSYNFYCPVCQADEIDSEVSLSDPQDGVWYCSTCRNRHETSDVIPRHRIKDDVVNPVWDQLWIEKDDQRREIYENIEDQKSDLQEREFEQRREEIRSATNRIRDLRSRIRDLKTEAKAAEGKVSEIGDMMVKYERLHKERKQAFEQEVESSFAEIDEQTDRILEETRNEEEERIEAAEQAAKEKAEMMREEERQREIEKFVAQQQLADERAQAQMQQQEELHGEEMELEKRHHRENWMLETRGRTSFSGHIDKMKLRKDRALGASSRESEN